MTQQNNPKEALEKAFELFYEESKKLESQQADLQAKINLLSNELSDSNQRITILLNSMPAGVILLENQIVKIFNPAAMQFLPFLNSGQLFAIPANWQASITSGEYVIYPEQQQSSKRGGATNRANDPDITTQTVQLHRIDEGSRSIIQIQDITQNILTHQKSQHENRLASMGKMAASIAHQFRTPLSTALIYASHLCDQELDESTKQEFADRLRKQLIGLEKLSQDMLQFITNRPRKTGIVAITQLLMDADAAFRPLCEKKNVLFQMQLGGDSPQISAEKSSIVNALIAILENALVVSEPLQTIHLSLQNQAQRCQITIEDQGGGIPLEMLDSLFEPFATGHSNGTGLGLAIAKNAIEAHRGTILAENYEHGARFTITIPCVQSS